jgi:hypothetical protein
LHHRNNFPSYNVIFLAVLFDPSTLANDRPDRWFLVGVQIGLGDGYLVLKDGIGGVGIP